MFNHKLTFSLAELDLAGPTRVRLERAQLGLSIWRMGRIVTSLRPEQWRAHKEPDRLPVDSETSPSR